MKPNLRTGLLLLAVLAADARWVRAQGVVIDDFTKAQRANSLAYDAGILGRSRILGVIARRGSAQAAVADDTFSASFNACNGCSFYASLVWAGPFFLGFQPTDFTTAGATDSLRLRVTTGAAQASVPVLFQVASGWREISQATLSLSPGSTDQDVMVRFSAFSAVPGFAPADLTKVRSLGMWISSTTSFRLGISRIETAADAEVRAEAVGAFYMNGIKLAALSFGASSVGSEATQDGSGELRLSVVRCEPSPTATSPCVRSAGVSALVQGPVPAGTTINIKLAISGIPGYPDTRAAGSCYADRLPSVTIIQASHVVLLNGLIDHVFTLVNDEPGGIILRCEVTTRIGPPPL